MTEENKNNYKVLARKYRPSNFDDLIGQDVLVQTLSNAISQNRIAHAFILTGIRGVGKTTTARIIARSLNCIGEDGKGEATINPCGKCSNCVAISEDRHQDVIEMDAASRTGVDDIREIIENSHYLPASARYKIYIIDEVHMLSKSAFNALLKTLEEPPSHVKFIFATTEIRKIPITILSRCQRFDLRRISDEELHAHLKNIAGQEGAKIDDEAISILVRAAEGSARDSLSLLDQIIAHSEGEISAKNVEDMLGLADKSGIMDLFEHLAAGESDKSLPLFSQLIEKGADPMLILQDLIEFSHMVSKIKVLPKMAEDNAIPQNTRKRAKEFSEKLSVAYLTSFWQILLKGIGEVKFAPNTKMAAEMVLIKLAFMSSLPSPAEVVKDLQNNNSGGNVPVNTNSPAPVSNGGGSVATAVQVQPQEQDENNVQLSSFEEVVELFKQSEELLLYNYLFSDTNLISFTKGKIELKVGSHVPTDFCGRVSECLNKWTGEKWLVILSSSEGSITLAEKKQNDIEQEKQEISKTDDVNKVLLSFPGAKVDNVKTVNNDKE